MDVADIEVVEDRTAQSRCDQGFLRVRRLRVRNRYADGSASAVYDCDIVSRRAIDAVAVVLYETTGARVRVLLKDGVRPPVYLRRHKDLVREDPRPYLTVTEIAAGVLEPEDTGEDGIERRAAAEAHEECGLTVDPARVRRLGSASFPSPGVTDENVHFRAVQAPLGDAVRPQGDGSIMEEATRTVILDLDEAIARCRRGEIPDMKTEIGLLRLADAIGWLPQFGCFVHDLPPGLRERFRPPGMDAGAHVD